MRNKKNKINRHLELSAKFIEMGQALMKEVNDDKDYTVSQTGSFMVLIGGLLFDENDVQQFGQLCSMFSAKKILDNMEATKSDMTEFMKLKANGESYDDYIKRINKLRGDNGHEPLA